MRVTIPQGSSLGEIADLLERTGVVASAGFFQLRARLARPQRRPQAGLLRAARGHELHRRARRARGGRAARTWSRSRIPEGLSRTEIAPRVTARPARQLHARHAGASPALDPRDYGRQARAEPRGLPVPGHLRAQEGPAACARLRRRSSSPHFKRNFDKVDLRYAQRKNLTPYDVLIIASLIEREAMVPKERPLIASVIYNRLHDDIRLGHRRHRRASWSGTGRGRCRCPSSQNPSPYNTRVHAGPAARPDRQPRARLDQGRGPPRQDRLPLLRGRSLRHLRRAQLRRDRRRVPALRGRVQPRARRARRQVAHDLLSALAGVLGFPVGHSRSPAMMNAAFARARARLALPAAAGAARALRARPWRRCPARATAAPT